MSRFENGYWKLVGKPPTQKQKIFEEYLPPPPLPNPLLQFSGMQRRKLKEQNMACYSNLPVPIHSMTKCRSAFYVLIKSIFSYHTGAVEIKGNWVGENKSWVLSRKIRCALYGIMVAPDKIGQLQNHHPKLFSSHFIPENNLCVVNISPEPPIFSFVNSVSLPHYRSASRM